VARIRVCQIAIRRRSRLEPLADQPRTVHPIQERTESVGSAEFDTHQCGAGFAVVAFDVLEQRDVVVGTEYLIEEPPQRAGFLREVHQEIVFETTVDERPLDDLAVARNIVVPT
jgi:hypothetical protein